MLLSCDSLASSEDNTEHSHLSNMSSRSTTSSSRDKAVFMDMNIMLGKRKVYYVTRSTIKQLRSDSSDNNDDHVDKKHCLSPSSSSSSTRGGHGNHPRSNTHKTTRNSTAKWDETEAKRIILEYSIDPYDYSHDELIDLSVEIFRYYDLINTFHFTANAASNFFQAVKDLYSNSNDFHNFRHAFGVMHMCFQILLHGGDSYLDSFDVLAVLVAAICHDVGHPGNNNAFELAIQSDVSKLYAHPDEICVLEKYHASETQSLLTIAQSQSNKRGQKGKDRDILCGISESEKERFFHQVRFIILGTDMAKHTALVDEAKDLIGQIISKQHDNPPMEETKSSFTRRNEPKYSPTVTGVGNLSTTYGDAETRLALTRIIVHTADIGAQTQAIPVAVKWAERVYKEFRSQVSNFITICIVKTRLTNHYLFFVCLFL